MAIIFSFLVFVIMSKRKLVLITTMAAIAALIIVIRPEAIVSRVEYTFHEKESNLAKIFDIYLDPSASARIFDWRGSFEAWKENPILGRGIAGHGLIDGQYFSALSEIGAIGFLALLWLLWSIFKHSIIVYKKMDDEFYKGLVLGFIAGFIGLAFHAVTTNTFILIRIMEPFWFVTGIIMMLPKLLDSTEEEILSTKF
jgi:O-antigen ligase